MSTSGSRSRSLSFVADLTAKFLDIYAPDHARKQVAKYPGYYLGSIIISQKGSQPFIVDGQQRLTSLTLFLTYLRRLQHGRDDLVNIDELIYSEKFGEKSFNLDVADRNDCMDALFEHGEYDVPADAPESVHTLVSRYAELDGLFPDELKDTALPFFIDWLKDRVQLVQITAYSDDDAYAIFETMNDRGLKLTPADMLKGYLLANMEDGKPRTKANDLWRKRIRTLEEWDDEAGHWRFGELDWDEFWRVVSGDGPCNEQRLEHRRRAHEEGAWVREAANAYAAKQARRARGAA